MANNEIFKTALKGYKKEEVLDYISNLNNQLTDLKDELDRKDVQLAHAQKDIEAMQGQKTVLDDEQISELREQIRQELEAEYNEKLAAELETLKNQTVETSDVEQKAKEYDECKDTLADLIIQARKNADDIVNKAKMDAELLRVKAEAEFAELNADFSMLKHNVAANKTDMQRRLEEALNSMNQFEAQLAVIEQDIDNTTRNFKASQTISDDNL